MAYCDQSPEDTQRDLLFPSPPSSFVRDLSRHSETSPLTRIGPFELLRLIGVGGMGEVFEGRDTRLHRSVAIKRLHKAGESSEAELQELQREARLAATLAHPNIVTVYDLLEVKGESYLISEFIDGQTASDALHSGSQSFELLQRLSIAVAVLHALKHAHERGVVHHDIKLDNVLLGPDGAIKLADFGIAKRLHELPLLGEASVVRGTWHAMSPEQSYGAVTTHQSDLFSLGTMLYELFSGVSPLKGCNPSETVQRIRFVEPIPLRERSLGVPRLVSDMVHSLLRKDPSDRPFSAAVVLSRLEPLLSQLKTTSTPPPPQATHQATIVSVRLLDTSTGLVDPDQLATEELEALNLIDDESQEVHGTPLTSAGKSALICFGYPQSLENSGETAVRFATRLLERFCEEQISFELAVGIAAGSLKMSRRRHRCLAAGEAVESAAQLSAGAASGEVRVTSQVRSITRRYFSFQQSANEGDGSLLLGKSSSLLDGCISTSAPLVGRKALLRQLDQRWGRAHRGGRETALLVGASGMGKSRLALEWMRGLSTEDRQASVRLVAERSERFYPFHPWKTLFRGLLGLRAIEPASMCSEMSLALTQRGLCDPAMLLALQALFQCTDADSNSNVSPSDRREQMINHLARLFSLLVGERTTILLVEDLHWLDHSSLELLRTVLLKGGESGLFALLTCWPEFVEEFDPRELVSCLHIPPLDRWESLTIVEALSMGTPLPPHMVRELLDHADGSPLVLEELTLAVVAGHKSSLESDGVRSLATVPLSLRDTVNRRLDRFTGSTSTVQAAAILGSEGRLDILSSLLARPMRMIENEIRGLARQGLIFRVETSRGPGYKFPHILIQEAVRASITEEEASDIHHRITQLLMGEFLRDLELFPGRFAIHFAQSGLWDQAFQLYQQAAHAAVAQSAFVEARCHFESALVLLHSSTSTNQNERERELRLLLAPCLRATEGWGSTAVEENLKRLRELSTAGSDLGLLFGLWSLGIVSHDAQQTNLAMTAIEHAEPSLARDFVHCTTRGVAHFYEGHFDRALTELQQATEIVSQAVHGPQEDEQLCVDILRRWGCEFAVAAPVHLAWLQTLLGDTKGAKTTHLAAEALLTRLSGTDELRELRHGFYMRIYIGLTLQDYNFYDAFEGDGGALGRFIRLAGTDYPYYRAVARIGEHRARTARGEAGAAKALRRAYQEIKALATRPVGQVFLSTIVLEACLEEGQLGEAAHFADEAGKSVHSRYSRFFAPEALRTRADWLIEQGDYPAAQQELQRATELVAGLSLPDGCTARLFEERIARSTIKLTSFVQA